MPDKQVQPARSLKILFAWSSASRPFKRRGREFFSTAGTIALLFIIILVFFKEWLLIVVIIAMAFVAYVLSTVPPEQIDHQITTRGLLTGGKNYLWTELISFWFEKKWGQPILFVETGWRFPRRLMILVEASDKAKIKNLLADYLPSEKPEKFWLDKAGQWLTKKFPLE